MRRRLFLALALLLALGACSGPRETPVPRGAVVLVLGDSITAAHGLPREASWVSHLAGPTGWRTINGGVSGDTVQQGRDRLGALLEEHRPAAVIVELGGNDMLRRHPVADIRAGLAATVADIRQAGARPILMAIPAPSVAGAAFGNLADAGFYADVAKNNKLPLIDEAVAEVLSKSALKLDQLHPNAEGHRVLADKVAAKLRKLGLSAGA